MGGQTNIARQIILQGQLCAGPQGQSGDAGRTFGEDVILLGWLSITRLPGIGSLSGGWPTERRR